MYFDVISIALFAGLRMAAVIELGLVVGIFVFCFARRNTRTRRRQHILKRKYQCVLSLEVSCEIT
jgi:protein kinase C substrate 80K-H